MPDLMTALRNADAAGDTEAANRIAAMIRAQQQPQTDPSDLPPGDLGPSFAQPKPESTLGETLSGVGEAALTTATGVTGGALGFLEGSIEGAARNLAGDLTQKEAMDLAKERASSLTYQPEGEVGKGIVKSIGETLGVLPPVGLTGGVIPKFAMTNSPLGKKIAETGSERIKKDFTKKLGEDRFKPNVFGMVKEARKQGFDDGMTTMIANSPAVDKHKFSQMVKVMESGKGKTLEQQRYRPADVAGDSLLQDVNFLRAENKKAGQDLYLSHYQLD